MNPAFSVIFFTTASGAGYGLMALLGLLAGVGWLPVERTFGLVALALAFTLVTLGLLSSTLHLTHPERAWRAFSQWRTSWLSREGVAAVLWYLPAGAFGLLWVWFGRTEEAWAATGAVLAALSAVTVYCTAMIYRSLTTVHQWGNRWTVPNYLALAAMTGALALNALLALFGYESEGFAVATLALVGVAAALKVAYWRFIDTTHHPATAGSATGLGGLGQVRLFEAGHTEENYLLKEMGFQIGRAHAARLRRLAVLLAFAAPFALLAAGFVLPGPTATAAAVLVALSAAIGVVVERWLFFAEARHTVTLYYGAQRV